MRNPRPEANEPMGRPAPSLPGRIAVMPGRIGYLAFALALLAMAAAPAYAGHPPRTTEQSVAEALTCQCGCGLTIANCDNPKCSFAVPMRAKIAAMIKRGMGRAQIIAYFRSKYGEKILAVPTAQGFNLLAWTMPFAALFLGGALVLVVMGRWRGTPSEPPPPVPPHDAKLDSELRERLERELRERI